MRARSLITTGTIALLTLTSCGNINDVLGSVTSPQTATITTTPNTLGSTTPNSHPENLATTEEISQAKELLPKLTVATQDSTGYNRTEHFGKAWLDVDNNGCDTRNDILARDLTNTTTNDGCTIQTGTLEDPYTGQTINFTRGKDTSSAIQIDHIVALNEAWGSGANTWDQEKRIAFANDPANLMAVDGPSNTSKSAKDATLWAVPDNPSYQCTYITRQIILKAHYGLSIDKGEKRAMENMLTSC